MNKKINYTYIIKSLLIVFLIFACSEDKLDRIETGTITGKVVKAIENTPLENVKVSTNPSSSVVFTDENGDFIIEEVIAENYSVQAEADGFLTNFEGVQLEGGLTVNVVFEMQVETANNRPPNAPVLISPEDNATGVPSEVEFEWSGSDPDADDVLTYTLTLRNDMNDEEQVFDEITDTTFTVTNLLKGTKYFWEVTASDDINDPVTSTISSFETEVEPNNRFAYVKQINGNNVIFSSDSEGNEVQLTSETMNSWRPRKNNTANKIAYLSAVGAQTHLFTMDFDGSNKVQITESVPVNGFNLDEVDFSWAEDGSELIYPNFNKLYRISSSGIGTSLLYTTSNGNFITECDWNFEGDKIALKTNDADGYNIEILVIDTTGTLLNTILSGVPGAGGGINFSIDSNLLLYTYDVSDFVDTTGSYRQLDSRVFIYDFSDASVTDASESKDLGTNDLDPRFSPTDAQIIVTNINNDGTAPKAVLIDINTLTERTDLFEGVIMPDYE